MCSQRLPYQGELDGRFVADGELVIPGRDAPRLLQKADPTFDLVPALVRLAVETGRAATGRASAEPVSGLVALLRDGVRDLSSAQVGADLAGGVGAVGEHMVRSGARTSAAGTGDADLVHDLLEDGRVTSLACRDDSREDVERGIHGQVNLGGQATARATEAVVVRLGRQTIRTRPARIVSPLLRAPAACWWARQTVESTETSHSIIPSASALTCNFFKMRGQVPSICHRRKTVYAVSHGPYRSGTSRQGEPVRARHQIPSKTCRRSLGGRPILDIGGNSGSSRSHCVSVRSPQDI